MDKNEFLEAEFSAISNGNNSEIKPIQFKFEDVLSEETGSETLSQDWEEMPFGFCVYFKNYPLKTNIHYIVDEQNDLYVWFYLHDEYAWYKVVDEEFKQLIIQFKE